MQMKMWLIFIRQLPLEQWLSHVFVSINEYLYSYKNLTKGLKARPKISAYGFVWIWSSTVVAELINSNIFDTRILFKFSYNTVWVYFSYSTMKTIKFTI